jgi:hypothetical protein
MNKYIFIANGVLMNVEFMRFEYDIEKPAKAVENSPLQTFMLICLEEVFEIV